MWYCCCNITCCKNKRYKIPTIAYGIISLGTLNSELALNTGIVESIGEKFSYPDFIKVVNKKNVTLYKSFLNSKGELYYYPLNYAMPQSMYLCLPFLFLTI